MGILVQVHINIHLENCYRFQISVYFAHLSNFLLSATFVGERGEIANANYTIKSSGTLGNADYRAPEMDNCPALINQKADVFSLGLLFYEVLCPMLTSLERKTNFDRFRSATFDWEDFNHFRKQMLNFMLKANPSNRASTEDILLYLDLGV